MIIIDTGPIVAIFDRDDKYHQRCIEILKGIKEPLITTCPVITEAFYLLNFSPSVQDDFWEFIQRGAKDKNTRRKYSFEMQGTYEKIS